VMADILPYLGVEQHFSEEELQGKSVVLSDMTGKTREEAKKELESQSLSYQAVGEGNTVTGQIPAAGQTVPGGSKVILYFGEEPEERLVAMPDLLGMTRQQASDTAGQLGIYILVKGNTSLEPSVTVAAQSVAPGTMIPVGTTVTLEFIDTKAAA